MACRCPHCGQVSPRDDVCTKCGQAIEQPQPGPQQPGVPGAPQAAPGVQRAPRPRPAVTKQGRPAWVYWLAAAAGLLVLGLLGCFIFAAWAAKAPPGPANWKRVESKTKHLTLEVPSNWRFTTSGSEGTYEWATVQGGMLHLVSIKGNATRGAIGDVGAAMQQAMGGLTGGEELPTELKAEATLHTIVAEAEKERDPNYRETGDIKPCTFAGRSAVYSEYTTVRRFGIAGVKMKGWRMSTPAGDYGYDVRVLCPAKNWQKFEPTATKILNSVQFGAG
jgi:hypothetical protein